MIQFYLSKQLLIEANICPIYGYEVVIIIIIILKHLIREIRNLSTSITSCLFVIKYSPRPPSPSPQACNLVRNTNKLPVKQRINYKMKIRALSYGNKRM